MLRKSSFELNKLLVFNVFTDVYNHHQYLNSDSALKCMKYHTTSSLIDLPLVSSFVKWIMLPPHLSCPSPFSYLSYSAAFSSSPSSTSSSPPPASYFWDRVYVDLTLLGLWRIILTLPPEYRDQSCAPSPLSCSS